MCEWRLPSQTVARYVRVQLCDRNDLHMAQVEVFGVRGTRAPVGRVTDVATGNQVGVVVVCDSMGENVSLTHGL
jgi:hypothetical protein